MPQMVWTDTDLGPGRIGIIIFNDALFSMARIGSTAASIRHRCGVASDGCLYAELARDACKHGPENQICMR